MELGSASLAAAVNKEAVLVLQNVGIWKGINCSAFS